MGTHGYEYICGVNKNIFKYRMLERMQDKVIDGAIKVRNSKAPKWSQNKYLKEDIYPIFMELENQKQKIYEHMTDIEKAFVEDVKEEIEECEIDE